MKSHSQSRHSSRRPALLSTGSLLSPAVRGSRATGHESQISNREPRFTDRASLITNHYSPITHFLIGSSAIRNVRNSSAIITKCVSNRSKSGCLRARFSHVLRSTNHESQRTTHAFLIATRQILEIHLTRSQQTRKLFLIATFSRCLAHALHLATHHLSITIHKSRVTNHESRYNHASLRAAGQSNEEPGSAAGGRLPARHETGFGLRSSNIAAPILRH
jgi:hypothetical protein